MVPHVTIEESIEEILAQEKGKECNLVIIGQPDEAKGEQLILVIEEEINFSDLRRELTEKGLPNLWIPKKYLLVKEIPMLPTGKIDFLSVGKLIR